MDKTDMLICAAVAVMVFCGIGLYIKLPPEQVLKDREAAILCASKGGEVVNLSRDRICLKTGTYLGKVQ